MACRLGCPFAGLRPVYLEGKNRPQYLTHTFDLLLEFSGPDRPGNVRNHSRAGLDYVQARREYDDDQNQA